MKTKILTLSELQSLIPECGKLEGVTYENIKELLTNLVFAIEQSGNWEFIQYINNNPSLFIIRKTSIELSKSLENASENCFKISPPPPILHNTTLSDKLPWDN